MQEMQETHVQSLGVEDPLEEEMATQSSIPCLMQKNLAAYSLWGHKQSDMTAQRVGHDWATELNWTPLLESVLLSWNP